MKIRKSSRWLLVLVLALPGISHAQDYSRTEVITYHDNLAKWVIGQVATVTCTTSIPGSTSCNGNDLISKTDYDANAMPWKTYSFGKLQQTYTWTTAAGSQAGTLRTITDGNINVTTFGSWKRGIPQAIRYPITQEAPAGGVQRAVVDDNGWIKEITDENEYVTKYDYDTMGRLKLVDYPDGDTPNWTSTTRNFSVQAAKYGLPNHWRLLEATGNGFRITRYDALWRPVIEETYDNADPDNTRSLVVKRYDSSGRLAFQSYPLRTLVSYTDLALKGVTTEYDALDRVTAVRQDAEGGAVLSTTTVYTPNRLKTEVTNPNGKTTYTWYMAYDQPHYDWPIQTYHPESMVTEIGRDALGKPLTLTRRDLANTISSTRRYLYNVAHELCKTIEPETGSTVMHYDGAGNLDWSATGLNLPSLTSCDETHASIAARKVSRTYDARNRLKTLRFLADTRGDQDWFYTPDGLPSKVVTANVPGAVHPENHYAYNKRRLLTTETQHLPAWYSYSLGYTYNANGHLQKIHYPSTHSVDFAPNALGQARQVKGETGHIYAKDVSYYPNGAIAGFTYGNGPSGNGVVYTMEQNERQLPKRVDSAGVQKYEYWYDGNGNPTHIHDQTRGGNYSRLLHYDDLDRLTDAGSASFGGDHWHRFTYNALDNLVTWKHGGVKDHRYCYSAANRLEFVRSGATTCSNGAAVDYFQYDVQGNVERHDDRAFDFDFGNRLREVIDVERYRYDAHGRRVLAMNFASGTITSQYGQNGQLLYQKNQRTGQMKEIDHIYLAGSLIAQREASLDSGAASVKYLHTDALGSPVAVTNQSGAVTERMVYEPYGKQMATTASIGQDRPGYTGHVRDTATGMLYAQQRYLHQDHPVFLSVDPVTALSNPVGQFHRYRYANNNPYKFTDPDGRMGCSNLILPCGTPEAIRDTRFDSADRAVARDAYLVATPMMVPAVAVGIIAAGPTTVATTAKLAKEAIDVAKSDTGRAVICLLLSCKTVDPAKPRDVITGEVKEKPTAKVVDTLKRRAEQNDAARKSTRGDSTQQGGGKDVGDGNDRVEGRIDSLRLDQQVIVK